MRRGEVPGCFVDERLLARIEGEAASADKGRLSRLDRTASWLSYFLRKDRQKSKVTLPRQFP